MLGATRKPGEPFSLLDRGCGLAHMLDYIRSDQEWDRIRYTGLDISPGISKPRGSAIPMRI